MDSFMLAAIEQARLGQAEGGIPIGSVLVYQDEIIGRGHNRRIQRGSTVLHGEMDALENAGRQPASVYRECTIYTTLSPCSMCSGAILLYGIPPVVIGENQTFRGEEELLESRGVNVTVLQNIECIQHDERVYRSKSRPVERRHRCVIFRLLFIWPMSLYRAGIWKKEWAGRAIALRPLSLYYLSSAFSVTHLGLSPEHRKLGGTVRGSHTNHRTDFQSASIYFANKFKFIFNPQSFVHNRAGCGVLKAYFLLRVNVLLNTECGERPFVKSAQDQLFLSGVGVDVTHGKNAGYAGLEFFGVYIHLAFVQVQTPIRDRSQVGGRPQNTNTSSALTMVCCSPSGPNDVQSAEFSIGFKHSPHITVKFCSRLPLAARDFILPTDAG